MVKEIVNAKKKKIIFDTIAEYWDKSQFKYWLNVTNVTLKGFEF